MIIVVLLTFDLDSQIQTVGMLVLHPLHLQGSVTSTITSGLGSSTHPPESGVHISVVRAPAHSRQRGFKSHCLLPPYLPVNCCVEPTPIGELLHSQWYLPKSHRSRNNIEYTASYQIYFTPFSAPFFTL